MSIIEKKHLFYLNSFFLAAFCLFIGLSLIFAKILGFYAVVPVSIIILGIAPYIFVRKFDYDVKEIFSIRGIKTKEFILVIIGAIAVLFLSQIIAGFASKLYELFGKKSTPQITLKNTPFRIIVQFGITCLFVPFFEEFFFRGFMNGMYKKIGFHHHAILSGVLFGLFHIQFHVVIGTIFAGIIWGYFVKYTGSLIAGIIPHILFNGTTLALLYTGDKFKNVSGTSSTTLDLMTVMFAAIISTIFTLILIFILKKLRSYYYKKQKHIQESADIQKEESEITETEFQIGVNNDEEPVDKIMPWSPILLFCFFVVITSVGFFFK